VLKAAKSFLPLKLQATPLTQVVKLALNVCDAELFRRVEVRLWPLPYLVYVGGLCDV
jgi:hypothetical protein